MAGTGKNHSKLYEQEEVRKMNQGISDLKDELSDTGFFQFSRKSDLKERISDRQDEKSEFMVDAYFSTKVKDFFGRL